MNREQQHQQVIEQYIREGRNVSGGKQDNPPDRYALVQLNGDRDHDLPLINASADAGFRFEAVLPFNYVLMGNYKENK